MIDLEQVGIEKESIFAVPLDKYSAKLSDVAITHQDAHSKVDLVFIFGTIFMLLGTIYGFKWHFGPILWGLFGLVFGALFGFGIEFLVSKHQKIQEQESKIDVIIIVHCTPNQSEIVERILWNHHALGVAKTRAS